MRIPVLSAKVVAVIAALIGAVLLTYVIRSERAVGERDLLREREKGWTTAVETLNQALVHNDEALAECRKINADNAADLAFVEGQLDAAELELMLLERRADEERETWLREDREFRERNDTTCRALTDPLPDWLVAGVRDPAAAADSH